MYEEYLLEELEDLTNLIQYEGLDPDDAIMYLRENFGFSLEDASELLEAISLEKDPNYSNFQQAKRAVKEANKQDKGFLEKAKANAELGYRWSRLHPWKTAAGAAGAAGLIGGAAYLKHRSNANARRRRNMALGAGGAALAGLGTAALLKYLRKKKS